MENGGIDKRVLDAIFNTIDKISREDWINNHLEVVDKIVSMCHIMLDTPERATCTAVMVVEYLSVKYGIPVDHGVKDCANHDIGVVCMN